MKRKKSAGRKLTVIQRRNLARLRGMRGSSIDYSDLPETKFTGKAQRGLFHRTRKESITIRIDQDVLAYYRKHAADGRYQTAINQALRQQMDNARIEAR
jgi:uncharacterized protein (DUF4415 family)